MSNEGDRAAVFRTTKVRTKLKGDGSWLRRGNEPETETQEEKPWVAEVRASRVNGAPTENSPVSSPTNSTPPPTTSVTERAPASGYLIRGVFTKLDRPASSSTSNGFSRTTQFTNKPSEGYKRIAPHTVRPTSENQEGQLSPEEMEKRTEAASSVLKKSAVRQRSYVLSAAKKYESTEKAPDAPPVNSTPSFVAKRVEITDDDDDESAVTPAPAKTETPSPVVSVTPAASAPEPKPRKTVSTAVKTDVDEAVNEPVAPKAEEVKSEAVKEDPLPESAPEKDPSEGMTPGCTKVATPLPELIVDCIQAVSTKPDPEDSDISTQAEAPLVELSQPPSETPTSSESPAPGSAVLESPSPVSPVPVVPAPPSFESMFSGTTVTVKTEPQPESSTEPESGPEPEQEPESKPPPEPSSSVDTLTALSNTLISFDTSPSSVKDDEPALAQEEEEGSADNQTVENSNEQEAAPALSNCEPITDDLLGFTNGPEEELAEPVPPSPGRWSQDLLSELDSEPSPAKTSSTLDLLTSDVFTINTQAHSVSMQQEEEGEEEEQTDETANDTQSQEDSVDPWRSHVKTAVTESSSADPFDPYPIGTTSPNSSSDLIQPLADISINSVSPTSTEDKNPDINLNSNALESLADNIIPIDTSLSTQRSWETDTPQQTNTEESQEGESGAGGQAVDQQTLVLFERKSSENDSPWDRWTSPTVYTITSTTGEEEEEEEEESPEDTQTVTTIRGIHGEPEPAMDRSESHSRTVIEEEQRVQTPEPEAKKGFVYVKEYVNVSELSLQNPRDSIDSSISHSYSIPSRAPLSTTCTYCGQQVGCDGKITIEHLNINCHPACFKCDMCSKPMGDLLYSMFLHGGKVYCEGCYSTVI